MNCARVCCGLLLVLSAMGRAHGQVGMLERELLLKPTNDLVQEVREQGDARRGAIVFFSPYMTCNKCHTAGEGGKPLGPDLTKLGKDATASHVIESILQPSKIIKKGFETVAVIDVNGKNITGLFVEDRVDALVLRDANSGQKLVIKKSRIEQYRASDKSIMPQGLVNQLASRQQFLDLAIYVIEIAEKGPARALELQPPPSVLAAAPLPEYEKQIDHAGSIRDLNQQSYKRGEAIYNRLCINCHGTVDKVGSLPTSLRFAEGKFKNGSDPFRMYQTLTRGFGMMVPQTWMVPEQKYDVIHYIREAYLKPHNPSQYSEADATYLARLPKGTTRGPKPSNIVPWQQMEYGPNLVATYEIGSNATNFAYKGNAIRLDAGPGGVSRGQYWMVYDYDTLRVAAAWSGKGFIDWNGINFNGRHGIHPRVVGQVHVANPTGPGWASADESFEDNARVRGRDNRIYGPLPRKWAHYKGMYYHGDKTLISYTVGDTPVLEMPGLRTQSPVRVFTRTFNIGARERDLVLQVAHRPGDGSVISAIPGKAAVLFGPPPGGKQPAAASAAPLRFNGQTRVKVAKPDDFDFHEKDFAITARIKTRSGGTILAKTSPAVKWEPDGKTLFVRGGRLTYDVGWVGMVQSKRRVDDGNWHNVAATFDAKSGMVRLYVDGKPDGQRELKAKQPVRGHVLRIGYTASDFPAGPSFFNGEISELQFYQRRLSDEEIEAAATSKQSKEDQLLGRWQLADVKGETVADQSGRKHDGLVIAGTAANSTADGWLAAGIRGESNVKWEADGNNLRLRIPAGREPLAFTLWMANIEKTDTLESLTGSIEADDSPNDLKPLTKGGPSRWPDVLKTKAVIGKDDGPFAVDVLTRPINNPWFCRMRLTGFDFYPDGDRAAVCAWEGSVWLVSGLANLKSGNAELTWRRIASGLFQPLGLKIIDGKIHITCRDQLCILHDLNADGEADYFQSLNNDHQVTDHFHEFAMGLQTDADGNFYYAKSARHALTALVPHHGTLLRVSKDGSKTDIVATGFRAANGVCVNPDGTFIVTDQEGHWNPKNRINWVKEGGFYGNMFGYHDVKDSSDAAMQQPLCWITNSFDRSPSELMWVDSKAWGPLNGSLLNFSYGYGKIYVVPHEKINGQVQGGMCELPIPRFPTGVMRGRFHPKTGQLFTCGMFAWAGNQTQPGGFYRVRYTGKPIHLPIGLNATKQGMRIKFSGKLDRAAATDAANFKVKTWSLRRTANYGSKHFDERPLKIAGAALADDDQTVFLTLPDIQPTWCMEIRYSIKGADGQAINGVIHNTIHNLTDAASSVNR